MSCCDETTARVPDTDMSRRSLFKGAAVIASVIPAARPARAQGKQIKLAYCSQLLCGPPYEVARSAGHFKNHGLDVQIVYARGGGAAMQALVGGAVDYAATALDVAIQAYANVNAGHPPLRGHRAPTPVCRCHRSQDRRPDSIDQGSGGKDGRRFRARQCRSCADTLSAEAGRRRRRTSPVRHHGRQSAGGIAPGPDRRRPGAGAGSDTAAALGRARARERHGSRRRQALSRRFV